ncbi:hypothetical protein AAGS40_30275 (plasmid) [Paraburkholderia sp. PREW-6R]|uniref:hypothetical protein n=1 Tax=Paraburkholderia sp. PREW-6R TaxID=3141544 RepID=UPI0031F4C636
MTTYDNENENTQGEQSRENAGDRVSRKGTGFMTQEDASMRGSTRGYAPELKHSFKRPLLYLIGFGSLVAGTAMWLSPDDQVLEAERTRYASREACLQDWNASSDCEFVSGDNTTTVATAASEALASDAAGSGHGGGGVSRASNDKYAAGKTVGAAAGSANGPLDAGHGVATTSTTASANGSGELSATSTSTDATSGWYGPYYTRDGVVYHASGLHTTGVPVQHGTVSVLAVRESALSADSAAFRSTPRTVSVSEGRAIVRGGFLLSRGGLGGHGGGEAGGGGHGSGGG